MIGVEGVSKSFGGVRVLHSIDLEIGHGRVIGVVGENGAGKSTLLNILSGIVQPDEGRLVRDGSTITFDGYAAASAAGISRVFQEQALIPNARVYENLLLAQERRYCTLGQILRSGEMIRLARDLMDEAGVAIDVRRRTGDYSFSKRQLIEIVRACLVPRHVLGIEHPIVLLDEPTASLEKADEEAFFRLMSRMRQTSTLVFVSHRLTEVLEHSDVICVLKDGHLVATVNPEESNERRLHSLMVGRERDADYYHEERQLDVTESPIAFRSRDLGQPGSYSDIAIEVREGEVLGIGGLLESGKSEFGKGVAGVDVPSEGEVALADRPWESPVIRKLIKHGLGYVPGERLAEGMISSFPVSWNISIASGEDLFSNSLGMWRSTDEVRAAEKLITRLGIKAKGPNALCRTLSGGNQQKVVLARWLCRRINVLILDNPTRGIDAGAKEEIYRLIRELTASGVAIVLITDELLELIGLSNRIAIMKHGRVAATVPAPRNAKPTEQQLIELMLASNTGDTHHSPNGAPT